MSRNDEIASVLEEFAQLLEAKDVEYKPRSYRRAAENIREHGGAIEALAADGEDAVAEIEGVGDAISSKIVEYFETGTIEELEELREEFPVEMAKLTSVEGVGPKTVGTLYETLGVRTLDDLEAAAEAGEIQNVSGFGATTEQNILENIPFARQSQERQLLGHARPYGEDVVAYLADREPVENVELAGSLRRWRATIGDVDVLVASEDSQAVVDEFTDWPGADSVIEAGDNKASVRSSGVRVDLRVVAPDEFGAALQYFTGSKEHNVVVRNRAIGMGLKMNEYGTFDVSELDDADSDGAGNQRAGERVAGETEASMYAAIDLPWIPPELREDRGEVQAAEDDALPTLLEADDVKGDLHTHTNWSDGQLSIREHVAGAAEFGHDYIGISDHATGPGMVGGVGIDDEELREQLAEIRSLEDELEIPVFAGVEANIDVDGEISVDDDLLAELDCVVASPHSGLNGDGTDRLITAAKHPAVDIIGHPTGRLLNEREGMDLDVRALARVAAEHDTALEINANPSRLDLSGSMVQMAIEEGATIAINTDAHSPAALDQIRYGVHTARRGWAEAADVLNTRDVEGIREFLH